MNVSTKYVCERRAGTWVRAFSDGTTQPARSAAALVSPGMGYLNYTPPTDAQHRARINALPEWQRREEYEAIAIGEVDAGREKWRASTPENYVIMRVQELEGTFRRQAENVRPGTVQSA
jgi:hypothetical protein